MTAAREDTDSHEPGGRPEAPDEDMSEDESDSESEEVEQHPPFTDSIGSATASVQEQLNEDLDLEAEAQDLPENESFSRPEIRNILSDLAKQEINTNRPTYRGIIHQNLSNNTQNWDDGVSEIEKVNKIDELIDSVIQIWVDRHIDEFVKEVENQDKTSTDAIDLTKLTIGAGILQGIVERVASDAIYEEGMKIANDIIQWFVTNTPITPDNLFHAVEAMLRALFGV